MNILALVDEESKFPKVLVLVLFLTVVCTVYLTHFFLLVSELMQVVFSKCGHCMCDTLVVV